MRHCFMNDIITLKYIVTMVFGMKCNFNFLLKIILLFCENSLVEFRIKIRYLRSYSGD